MDNKKLEVLQEAVHAKREAGFNCAEGVFWGIAQSLELDVPISCVTGFGGGIGGTGSVCGALTGAIAALGIYVGRQEADDTEAKNKCIELSKNVVEGFEKAMGTQICHEILGHMPGSVPRLPGEGINPACIKAVKVAIELALKEIE